MTFEEMAGKRYSVKKYDSSKPVEEEKLAKILEVANLAPTARDKQCIRIYVLKSEEAMNKVRELTPCTYGAPVCLLLAYEKSEAFEYPEENDGSDSGAEDCSIVATHVMFEALEQGLGTCWVNKFSPTAAKKAFQLPESQKAVLLMDLGYPAPDAAPLPLHSKRKELGEYVTEL